MRRIWAHWGVTLDDADLAAALAVYTRDAVAAHLDPTYGEDIAPDRAARQTVRLGVEEAMVVGRRLVGHLRCDFGYAARLRRRREAAALTPVSAAV